MSKRVPSLARIVMLASVLSACSRDLSPAPIIDAPQRVMPTAEAEAACNSYYQSSETGKRRSWKGRLPVVFSFDVGVPKVFVTAITSAMRKWNVAAGKELFRADPVARPASMPGRDHRNTIYFFSRTTPEPRSGYARFIKSDGGVASTSIHAHGNQIDESDIVFNGFHNRFSTTRVHLATFDMESTALHELGHTLGLDHIPRLWSTMFAYGAMSLGLRLRYIDDQTKSLLECEY